MKKYNVAILGATGAVGQEFLNLIEERNFPFANLKMLASKRSAGKKIQFMGKEYTVEETTDESFKDVEIALFAGGAASKQFAPAAVKAGAVVIDNSSAFRMDPEVPLVVPEVNPQAIARHKGIIANPNCSTIIMMMALKPLYDLAKVKRIVVSTYQAVSGGGKEAMAALEQQVDFEDEVSVEAARKAIDAFPGAIVRDNPAEQIYPMPLFTSGKNDVEVGRIRKDESIEHGLNLWVCGDQIRKGAALNALQIAEYMIKNDMI